jgi:NAD+ diphosphatase
MDIKPAQPSRPHVHRTPPMARSALQRQAHRRTDPQWLAEAWQRSRVLVVDADGPAASALLDGERLVLLDPADAPAGERIFLGEDEAGTPYFAVLASLTESGEQRRVTVRDVGHLLSDLESGLFITAIALANWHTRHTFSSETGGATEMADAGWARVAPGGRMIWPRTDPAVIVLVHDGVAGDEGRCLLGHNAAWTRPGMVRRYSCLAGFVEAGESAEAAVIREVGEEVGVRVTHLRYQGSQAWPYPGSLMLGFHALADPQQPVRPDLEEIAAARWFTRSEIRAVLAGERDDFGLPMASSIAYFLLTEWLDESA